MSMGGWVAITVVNVISVLLFWAVRYDAGRFMRSQVQTLGQPNRNWVHTRRLRMFRALYGLMVLLLIVFSYALLTVYDTVF